MSKGIGQKIAIKFTEVLSGDISGNEQAFKVTGQEYKYVNGELIDGDYQIETVERYPIKRIWEDDFEDGIKYNLYTVENGLAIVVPQEKIYPVADTYARQGSTNTNYGSSGELCVLGYTGYYARTYLKFDVPLLPIVKAELFLFYFANDVSDREQRHHIKRIIENWEEMTLTYSNAPNFEGMGSLTAGSYGTLVNVDGHKTGINKWRSVDITNLVKEWQDGTYSNHGLTLDHNYNASYDGGVWASIKYRSKEYEDSNFHPYIKLVYDDNVSFDMGGTYSTSFQINGQYRIKWLEETPEDTAIKIELATVENEFSEISNGDVINTNGTIWIKATLSTEDVNKTPILKELWLEEPDAPDDQIRLVMHPQGRFNNVVGDLAVDYDASKGNLQGRGGAVESFSYDFTPVGLETKPNPHAAELITITPHADVAFTGVHYSQRYGSEKITVTANASVAFTYVGTVNP